MTSGNAILLTRYAEQQKALHLHAITYRRQIPSCTMTQINHNRHTDSHPIIRIRMNRDNNRTDNHPMDSHNRHMDNHPMMRHNRTVQHSMVHLHMSLHLLLPMRRHSSRLRSRTAGYGSLWASLVACFFWVALAALWSLLLLVEESNKE